MESDRFAARGRARRIDCRLALTCQNSSSKPFKIANARKLALPNDQHFPARGAQLPSVPFVTPSVSANLRQPVSPVRLWLAPSIRTVPAAVPEAAVDENTNPFARKHEIRFSWQSGIVKAIAATRCEQESPHSQFRLCVLAANPRHHLRPLRLGKNISHGSTVARCSGFC